MKPVVSIVVPLWNRADLVGITLESVLAQTYDRWELIVVDDGSNDGSWQRARQFAENDGRVKVLRRPDVAPKGAPTCRNLGLDQAQGDFVLFLDSDDWLAPDCLQRRLSRMNQRGRACAGVVFQGGLFERTPGDSSLFLSRVDDPAGDMLERFLGFDWPWQTSQPLWKTAALREAGIRWKEGLLWQQDGQFHIDVLLAGLEVEMQLDQWAPDFLLRSGDGRERVTSQFGSVQQIRSTADYFLGLAQRLQETGYANADRSAALFAVLYWMAGRLADEESKRAALSFWRKARSMGACRGVRWLPGAISLLARRTRFWTRFDLGSLEQIWGKERIWPRRKSARSFGHPAVSESGSSHGHGSE